MRTGFVGLVAFALLAATSPAFASEGREEASVYVTSGGFFGSCNAPLDDAPIDDFNGACFGILPGETSLYIGIEDLVNDKVFASVTFYEQDGAWFSSVGTTFFCTNLTIDIPPEAAFLDVYLWSGAWGVILKGLGVDPCGSIVDDFATVGTITAIFV